MIRFVKMQISFIVSTIFTYHCNDWKDGTNKTWICSHKTWNPTSLTMEVKEFWAASHVIVRYPHKRKNREQVPKSKLKEQKPKVGNKGVQEQIMF